MRATDADNQIEQRDIKLGIQTTTSFEILSGVTATDQVIFNPADSLVSGATVRIAAATPEAKDK